MINCNDLKYFHDKQKIGFRPMNCLLQRLDVVPKEENNNFLTYVIPHEREALLTVSFLFLAMISFVLNLLNTMLRL